MKSLRNLLTAIVLLAFCPAFAQKATFPSLADQPGISNVYISASMLSMMRSPSMIIGNSISGNLLSKLTSIEVISAEENPQAKSVRKAFDEFVKAEPNLELLMNVSEDGEATTFYALPTQNPGNFSKVILFIYSEDGKESEADLIVLNGNITNNDLSSVAGIASPVYGPAPEQTAKPTETPAQDATAQPAE